MSITTRNAVFLSMAVLMSGCTTFAPERVAEECRATDWQRFGLNDGKIGVATSERSGEFSDCAEVGQPVDLAAYQTGRSEGLVSYCTAENGYQVGYDGRRYKNVCPPTLEPDFLQGFDRGRKDRPAVALYPRIGIGIGSGRGRVRTGIGIGIGVGSYFGCDYHWRYRHRC
ncbi:MAG: DUF2799 domain-containing protein [Pseudomonadota bacterium]